MGIVEYQESRNMVGMIARNTTPMYIILDVCRRVVYLTIIATLFYYAFAVLLSPHLITFTYAWYDDMRLLQTRNMQHDDIS